MDLDINTKDIIQKLPKSLITLLSSQPSQIRLGTYKTWKNLGRLKIENMAHKLNLEIHDFTIKQLKNIQNLFNGLEYNYNGQVDEQDRPAGIGRYALFDGHQVVEGYIDHKGDGYARMVWSHGGWYEGQFKGYKYHGEGKQIDRQGILQDGIWENGCFKE